MTGEWDNSGYRRGYEAAESDIHDMGLTKTKEIASDLASRVYRTDFIHGYLTCVSVVLERQMTQ